MFCISKFPVCFVLINLICCQHSLHAFSLVPRSPLSSSPSLPSSSTVPFGSSVSLSSRLSFPESVSFTKKVSTSASSSLSSLIASVPHSSFDLITVGQSRKPIRLENTFLARPIKKMTRIKLIKMLIKQIRRVARDPALDSIKLDTSNVTAIDSKVSNVSRPSNLDKSKNDPENLTIDSMLHRIRWMNEPSIVPLIDPSFGYVPVSSPPQPVYTWNQPPVVSQVKFWPAMPEPPTIQTDGQTMRLQLPLQQLSQLPVFIDQQLRSSAGQQAVQSLLARQWAAIRRSSDKPEIAEQRWKRFVRQMATSVGVKSSADRKWSRLARMDAQTLQEVITRILGGFVGDLVGVVVEEVLQKKGEIIANGIRLMVGDLATFVLSKGNLALELTLKNLTKMLFMRS